MYGRQRKTGQVMLAFKMTPIKSGRSSGTVPWIAAPFIAFLALSFGINPSNAFAENYTMDVGSWGEPSSPSCVILDTIQFIEEVPARVNFRFQKTCKRDVFDVKTTPPGRLLGFGNFEGNQAKKNFWLDVAIDTQDILLTTNKYEGIGLTTTRYSIGPLIAEIRKYLSQTKGAPDWQSLLGQSERMLAEREADDDIAPTITLLSPDVTPQNKIFRVDNYQTYVRGRVSDEEGVLTVLVNGKKACVKADGSFAAKLKLGLGANTILVQVEDISGNVSERTFTIVREEFIPEETLADVDIPPKTKMKNPDGLAVIIGVESYQYVPDATYAYNDAEVFREYLADTMGYSKSRVKIITNSKATLAEFNKLLGSNGWLARNIKPGKSDVVVYFAGHGIPDPASLQTGLLPFDVDPNYSVGLPLKELYRTLSSLKARTATVFLDACFTGETRDSCWRIAETSWSCPVKRPKVLLSFLLLLPVRQVVLSRTRNMACSPIISSRDWAARRIATATGNLPSQN